MSANTGKVMVGSILVALSVWFFTALVSVGQVEAKSVDRPQGEEICNAESTILSVPDVYVGDEVHGRSVTIGGGSQIDETEYGHVKICGWDYKKVKRYRCKWVYKNGPNGSERVQECRSYWVRIKVPTACYFPPH